MTTGYKFACSFSRSHDQNDWYSIRETLGECHPEGTISLKVVNHIIKTIIKPRYGWKPARLILGYITDEVAKKPLASPWENEIVPVAMVSRIKGETIIAVLDRDKGLSSVKEVVQ